MWGKGCGLRIRLTLECVFVDGNKPKERKKEHNCRTSITERTREYGIKRTSGLGLSFGSVPYRNFI